MKFFMEVLALKMTLIPYYKSRGFNQRTFKLLRWTKLFNQLVDLDEILYGGDDIEYYLDYILFNPVASTFQKWRT
jgi:hypothetical protein